MGDFRSDLAAAESTEKDAEGILRVKVKGCVDVLKVEDKDRAKYDRRVLIEDDEGQRHQDIEVKDDLKSGETGNWVVEKGRLEMVEGCREMVPSGINVTTANHWVFKANLNGEVGVYILPTAVIRWMITNPDIKKVLKWGGDDSRTHMYVFHGDLLVEHGFRLDLADDASVVLREVGWKYGNKRRCPPDKEHYQ